MKSAKFLLCFLTFVGLCIICPCVPAQENKTLSASNSYKNNCDRENLATSALEGAFSTTREKLKWTFCDGTIVYETKTEYKSVTDFEKNLNSLVKEGRLDSLKPIYNAQDKEIGSQYLIVSYADFQNRWIYIFREELKVTRFEGDSLVHILFLAEKVKGDKCKAK